MNADAPTRAIPNRRGQETMDLVWRRGNTEQRFTLSLGRELNARSEAAGPIVELFASGQKFGSEMADTLNDACRTISYMLRGDWSALHYCHKLNGVKAAPDGSVVEPLRPTSIIGLVALAAAAADGDAACLALLQRTQEAGYGV
jgi:hypothetical protein